MMSRCLLALLLATAASAPAVSGGWSIRIQHWQAESLAAAGDVAPNTERRAERAAGFVEHAFGRTGIVYEHQPIDLEAGSPATNGFLHQVDLTHGMRIGRTRLDVSLGVHGSSNMFDDGQLLTGGGDMRSDALVGRFRVMHAVEGWLEGVGLAGDYRFGEFLVYPRVKKSFALGRTEMVVELPVSIAWHDPGARWRLGLDRYGEHWATLDETETVEGKLYLDEWRLTGRYRLGRWRSTYLDLGAGLSFDRGIEYRDLERGPVEGELDRALFAFIEIGG